MLANGATLAIIINGDIAIILLKSDAAMHDEHESIDNVINAINRSSNTDDIASEVEN
jgi:hypothetical protein